MTGWAPVPPEMYLPPPPMSEEEGRQMLEKALARQEWDKKHPRCFDCGRVIKTYLCPRYGI